MKAKIEIIDTPVSIKEIEIEVTTFGQATYIAEAFAVAYQSPITVYSIGWGITRTVPKP